MNHDDTTDTTTEGEGGCFRLDAFLDGELDGRAASAFQSHREECSACAETIERQRWIDGLLRSREAAEFEAAPTWVVVASAATARRRRRRRVALGAALAAALATIAAWPRFPLPRREGTGEGRQTVDADTDVHRPKTVENPSPSPSLPGRGMQASYPQAAATFVSTGAIVVPVESSSPEVTIVQVYPTLDAQRRLEIAAAVSSFSMKPNGG